MYNVPNRADGGDKYSLTLLKTNSCTFCKIHSHSHLKFQTVKNVCETPN
jgi:hypothetical protein